MTKQHKILVVVVLVVLVAVFVYQNQIKGKTVVQDSDPIKENRESILNNTEGETALENTSTVNPSKKTLFSKALKEGMDAFNAQDYDKALAAYNQALSINDSDIPYYRIFTVYSAQNQWSNAVESLNKAIGLNPLYTEYWVTKLQVLDEKLGKSLEELKVVYNEGFGKAHSQTKVNMVTVFAGIAEKHGDYSYAISLWEKAIEVYPDSKSIYQAEIDRLQALQ